MVPMMLGDEVLGLADRAWRDPELCSGIWWPGSRQILAEGRVQRRAFVPRGTIRGGPGELAAIRSERDAAGLEIDALRRRQAETDAAHARLADRLARAELASETLGELRRQAERPSETSTQPASHTDLEGTEPAHVLATAAAARVWTVAGLLQQGLRSDDGATRTALAMNLVTGPAIAHIAPPDSEVATNIESDTHELGAHGPRGPPASPG